MPDTELHFEDLVIDGPEINDDLSESSSDHEMKPKKKKKSRTKRGTKFIVDGKVVPARALPFEEEKALYEKSRTLDERISIASRRYKQRAGLSSTMTTVFDNYLVYGAIGVWPDTITRDLDPISGAEKVDSYGRRYVFNIQFIVKAFLSKIREITTDARSFDIIKNFLRYLIDFEVCPEYTTDITAAAELCILAKEEAKNLTELSSVLPGRFNRACSALSGGYYADLDAIPSTEEWGPLEKLAQKKVAGEKLISSESTAFEILEIITEDMNCSRILTKQWINPAWPVSETDLGLKESPEKEWNFIVDRIVADNLRPGIKIEAVVRELGNGKHYFDKINAILNSFYEYYEKPEAFLYEDL